jgi:esterase/lipase superfamily enzyme
MQKQAWTWTTPRLPQTARMARWGHFGTPVLILPTAGGDFEEIERFQLVAALAALIEGGRIKVYSIDAVATRAWLAATTSVQDCVSLEARYDTFIYQDVLERIRSDCQDDHIEPILVGASLGAATAVSVLCHHPDSFRAAIGLSGVYGGGTRFSGGCYGAPVSAAALHATPLTAVNYVATLGGTQLSKLRQRAIVLGSGAGDYENPDESKRLADAFGAKAIPCRFDSWGPQRDHTWSTWRAQLPGLLAEQL